MYYMYFFQYLFDFCNECLKWNALCIRVNKWHKKQQQKHDKLTSKQAFKSQENTAKTRQVDL